MKKILCFIPARSGSKRISKKNIKKISGKTLISYTIDSALKSKMFTDIVVSSDSKLILKTIRQKKIIKDLRPSDLATDHVMAKDAVIEYLQRKENMGKYDIVAMLSPTCPFKQAKHIKQSLLEFIKHQNKFDSLMGITDYDCPPQFALCLTDQSNMSLQIINKDVCQTSTQSQMVKKLYRPNGVIYAAKTSVFVKNKSFFHEPLMGYYMTPLQSYDIDEPYQMEIARYIMKHKLHLKNLNMNL